MERTGVISDSRSTGISSVLCMQGGGGADSYAANSSYQIHAFHAYAKPHLAEAVRLMVDSIMMMSTSGRIISAAADTIESKVAEELEEAEESAAGHCSNHTAGALVRRELYNNNNSRRVAVADLGCSYGENALVYAKFIVDTLAQRFRLGLTNINHNHCAELTPVSGDHQLVGARPNMSKDVIPDRDNTKYIAEDRRAMNMELHYFFSDLPSNDFNHLFRSLAANSSCFSSCSSSRRSGALDDDQLITTTRTRVYAAGVPGSFYDRLFPSRSLNFVCCAFALHWLSQVPPEVLDKSSPSWNGGHVWIWGSGQRPQVAQAFARQSRADLIRFFRCRAEEMAKDATLFLFTLARDEDHDYLNLYNFMGCGFIEDTWNDMVKEGIISCEERNTFNIPNYIVNRKELELALKEIPELKILKLEVIEDPTQQPENPPLLKDLEAFGKTWAKFVESILKPMIQSHVGLRRTVLFFERLERVTTEKAHLTGTNLAVNYLIVVCQRC